MKDARSFAWDMMENDPRQIAEMCLRYMSQADIEDMLRSNDVFIEDEIIEQEEELKQEQYIDSLTERFSDDDEDAYDTNDPDWRLPMRRRREGEHGY